MIGLDTVSRVAKGATEAWMWIRRVPVRLRTSNLDLQDARDRSTERRSTPTAQVRLDELRTFHDQYNDLVETLCDSAQYGPTHQLESRYSEMRRWMLSHYAPLRKLVVAYLRIDASDVHQRLDLHGQSSDAFEALFCAPSLGDFLRGDDGLMISRMERTREALHLYGDHLRQMAAQENACA